MAKLTDLNRKRVVKKTAQNGSKTSSINKSKKTHKPYKGQGK